jgi:hypothetical protein
MNRIDRFFDALAIRISVFGSKRLMVAEIETELAKLAFNRL